MKVPAHLAAAFGTNDPAAVFFAAVQRLNNPLRVLLARVARRLGKNNIDFPDDQHKGKAHRIQIAPSSRSPQATGLSLAIVATRIPGGAALLADEARRMAINLPVGPKPKALDDNGDPLGGYALDDGELIDPTAFGLLRGGAGSAGGLATRVAYEGQAHTFEPVTVSLLVAVIGFLGMVAPMVLPTLIETGKVYIAEVQSGVDPLTAAGNVLSGNAGQQEREEAEKNAAAEAAEMQTKIRIALAIAALGTIAVVLYMRKKG